MSKKMMDAFGSLTGKNPAKANAVLSAVPKTMERIVTEGKLRGNRYTGPTVYDHLNRMVKRGFVRRHNDGNVFTYSLTHAGLSRKNRNAI